VITVRPAIPGDAPGIGRVHVDARQAAYRGLMPDEYLDGLVPDDREPRYRRRLGSGD